MANVLEILLKAKGGEQVKQELGKTNKAANKTKEIMTALGGILSVGIMAKGFSDALKAYEVQEVAVTKLNAALKTQGDFTEENSKALQDQASALQAVTTFGDEAIISAQALLLNYKLTKEEVQAATPAILDFAAATGKDVKMAAEIVGRSLIGEVASLKTYGITVDENTLKTKGMAGILETLEGQFGGTAEAVAKSGVGPMKQFQNTIGDVKERIGAALLPALNDMIKSLAKWLPMIEKVALGITAVVSTAIEGISTMANIVEKVVSLRFKEIPKTVAEGGKKIGDIWETAANRMVEIEEEAKEKRVEIVEEETKKKIGMGKFFVKKNKEDQEKITKKNKEESDKRIEDDKNRIIGTMNFRRQLRELDLTEVISALESELLEVSENEEKKKALHKALGEFKKELRVEEAVEVEALNDRITQLFVDGTKDWASAWQSFQSFIIDFILKEIAEEIVKTIGLGKALKAVLGGVTGGGFLGVVGGLLGFQGGGTVPGPRGQPRLIVAHGEERITPPGRTTGQVGGNGLTVIFQISGQFIEADETKWDRLIRRKIKPALNRSLKGTGEQFT